ncbi:hypothetical protein CTEN210_09134 [Chaetoceros tenuissimus]|uniref:rRNA biogenesis protein RRP36 n=1 Tax=Chaetoceros tenuissimus TaxID=426638 RepID=A0AAD3CV17_9STRA|nr:hypothetical protein CTEN210_09134 [Chaetoceros tenuissimus]
MEPASSSDDDSSIEQMPSRNLQPVDDDSSSAPSSSDDESDSDSDIEEQKNLTFEELPSDDSCLEDSDNDSDDEDSEEEEEDVPLSQRLHQKQNQGMESKAKSQRNKKKEALLLAQQRLKDLKKKQRNDSDSDDSDDDSSDSETETQLTQKKRSKHAPTIASSSRKAYFQRGAPDLNSSGIGVEIGAKKYKPRDPRMQSLSGYLDPKVFEKRYEFLEEIQDKEIDTLKQRLKAWKATGKKGNKMRRKLGMTGADASMEHDQEELQRLIQERSSRRDAKLKSDAKSAVKKRIREEVAAGKRGAYHLKRRDMKKLELEARFDQLRKKGGDAAVNKVLAKRRKRKMGKDSGLMTK